MPAPLDVDRDQVRMLVLSVGCTEAAQQTGIPLNTVLSWSARGEWLANAGKPTPLPASMQPRAIPAIVAPVDALMNILSEDERETRISLSKSARKLAKQAEDAPLEQAADVLQAAKTAAIVHRWQDGANTAGSVIVNIALMGLPQSGSEPEAIDLA